jgi:predicted TIM-barrel fold metal-dependent hydrolase
VAGAAAPGTDIPIIDTHIHLFDPTRPRGPVAEGNAALYKPALPERYRKLTAGLGITGDRGGGKPVAGRQQWVWTWR